MYAFKLHTIYKMFFFFQNLILADVKKKREMKEAVAEKNRKAATMVRQLFIFIRKQIKIF